MYRQRMSYRVRQGGPRRYLHRYTATPGESGEGWVPSHSRAAVFSPHGPVCVHGFVEVSTEQFPHRMTPDKRGSKCCCLMSCGLLSFSLGGRYFPTEPFTCLGCGYNGRQTRDQSSLLLDSSTRDLTTIFHSADEL